jgi:hypothetical protein
MRGGTTREQFFIMRSSGCKPRRPPHFNVKKINERAAKVRRFLQNMSICIQL